MKFILQASWKACDITLHCSTKQSFLLCAKSWEPCLKRILFLISLTTLASSQEDPLTALTVYSTRSSSVYIGIWLCMSPSTAELPGNLLSVSFTYTINQNFRNSGTFLAMTYFLEISHPCCGTDCRVLEERQTTSRKVRRGVCLLDTSFGQVSCDRLCRKNALKETLTSTRTRLLDTVLHLVQSTNIHSEG